MGLPIHLRGEAVFRFIGDRCGGFIEADESSVDLGSIRICVRCSEFTPLRLSFRWGMWQFSLPVWVEADPVVELWTPAPMKDRDSAPIMETTDFVQLGQDFQPRLGVDDYLQRFRREARPMGFQGNFTQHVGVAVGHPRGSKEGQLGWRQAQVFGKGEVGQRRWAVVKNKGTHLGAQVVKGVRSMAYQSSPQGGGFSTLIGGGVLGLSERPNSLANTVVGRTDGELGCRASCDLHPSESGRVASFGAGGHRRGSVSPSGLELVVHRATSSEEQGSRLVEASESGTSHLAGSKLDERQSQLELEMPRDAPSADEQGSRLLVASDSITSQSMASESVEQQSLLELEMPRDAPSVDEQGSRLLLASERGTSQVAAAELAERQSQLVLQMSRDASWVDRSGEGHENAGQSQVLELQPLTVLDTKLDACFKQKQRFEDTGGFSGEEIPSAEAVSQWVLDRISEVSHCLGLSFEGHEDEAMRLFAAVEAS